MPFPHLDNKSFVLITESSYGLGDFFASLKMIKHLRSTVPTVQIKWFITSIQARDALTSRIKTAREELGDGVPISFFKLADEIDWSLLNTKTDLILLFPTVHDILPRNFQRLRALNAPIIQLHEYDALERLYQLPNKYEVAVVTTGFSGLGLFLEDYIQSQTLLPIEEILPQPYALSAKRTLFFSYQNLEVNEQFNEATFADYARIALSIAAPGLPIDLVANSMTDELQSEFFQLAWELDFSGVALISKNKKGEYIERVITSPRMSDNEKTLRIINPFPLSAQQMQSLMACAHPLQQVTGDQSFSESLSCSFQGKAVVPFYQTMRWKTGVFHNWLSYAEQELGPDSAYVSLIKKMAPKVPFDPVEFAAFWASHQQEIMAESLVLGPKLQAQHNLYRHAPRFLNVMCAFIGSRSTVFYKHVAPLAAQLVRLFNEDECGRILSHVIQAANEVEVFTTMSALTAWLRLNPLVADEALVHQLIQSLSKVSLKDRPYVATNARILLTKIPASAQKVYAVAMIEQLARINTHTQQYLLQSLSQSKVDDKEEEAREQEKRVERPEWLPSLIDQQLIYQGLLGQGRLRNHILLAVNVYPDGSGDLAKYIGVYRELRKAFPQTRISSLIKCFSEKKAGIIETLRVSGTPLSETRIVLNENTIADFFDHKYDSSYVSDDYSLIISVATPFTQLDRLIRNWGNGAIPLIELAEIEAVSSLNLQEYGQLKDASHTFVTMGISADDVGFEITPVSSKGTLELFDSLSADLKRKLLDGAVDSARALEHTFFMPAYLKYDTGSLSVYYALELMNTLYCNKKTGLLWVYQLPVDPHNAYFLAALREKHIGSLVVYDELGLRTQVAVPQAIGTKELRIVTGPVNTRDFDLMYEFAGRTYGFAACVGQNSFEKAISFNLVPAFYAPPWQRAIIYQCQNLVIELFAPQSAEYQCLNAYLDLLNSVAHTTRDMDRLQSNASFQPIIAQLKADVSSPEHYMEALAHMYESLPEQVQQTIPVELRTHPIEQVRRFFATHDLQVLRAGWRTLSDFIIQHKNLNQWLVNTVKTMILQPKAQIMSHDLVSDELSRKRRLLERFHYTVLNSTSFPCTSALMTMALVRMWPNYQQHQVQLMLTDSKEYFIKPVQGMDTPCIAISILALNQLTQEELFFAVGIMANLYNIYPVENVRAQIEALSPEVLVGSIDTQLEQGISYYRKLITLGTSTSETENAQKIIKYIELLLADKHKKRRKTLHHSSATAIPREVLAELARSPSLCKQKEIQPLSTQTALQQIKKLASQLPQHRIRHINEYRLLTIESKEWLDELERITVQPLTKKLHTALIKLVDTAWKERFAGFDRLYLLVMKKINPYGSWEFLGPYHQILVLAQAFLGARDGQTAVNKATELEKLLEQLEYRYLFINASLEPGELGKRVDLRRGELADSSLWSAVGAHLPWSAFCVLPVPNSERYQHFIDWAIKDKSGLVAQLLFRFGVMNEKVIWPKLTQKLIQSFNEYDWYHAAYLGVIPSELRVEKYGNRPKYTLKEEFEGLFLVHCYGKSPTIPVAEQVVDRAVIEQFITAHRDELILSDYVPQTAHALLSLFECFSAHNQGEAERLIRQFYLDPSYQQGLYALRRGRASMVLLGSESKIGPDLKVFGYGDIQVTVGNTQEKNPFLHFLLKHRPAYIHLEHLFNCLSDNFQIVHRMWPLAYVLEQLHLTLGSIENALKVVDVLKSAQHIVGSHEAKEYVVHFIEKVYQEVVQTLPNIKPFSLATYQFLRQVISDSRYSAREVFIKLWQQPQCHEQLYHPPEVLELSTEQLAFIYHYSDRHITWANSDDRDQYARILLQSLDAAEEAKQLKSIELLLFGKIPLSDMSFCQQLIKRWAAIKAKQLGLDDNSYPYYLKSSRACQDVMAQCPPIYLQDLLEQLLVSIQAQHRLSEFVMTQLHPKEESTVSQIDKKSTLILVTQNLAKRGLSMPAVKFLIHELSQATLNEFIEALQGHYDSLRFKESYERIDRAQAKMMAIFFYHVFWSRSLEERAVLINSLLIPSSEVGNETAEQRAYARSFSYVASILFPVETDESAMGKALLTSFLEVSNPHIKAFMLTTVLSANKTVKGGRENITSVLPKLAEAMGAAGVKAGQAAHSYPKTPKDIRASLAYLKSQTRLPYRWELMKLIKTRVPEELQQQVERVNGLLGGASFYLAIEVTMKNGDKRVLRLMRDQAAEEAEQGFDHLKAMLVHCQHPNILKIQRDLTHIISEAEAGAAIEIDTPSVAQQYALAEKLYAQQTHQLTIDGRGFDVRIASVQLFAQGPGFQLISKAEGIEFNDLKKDPSNSALCKAIALAVCKTELTHLLGNGPCDIDRHGAQSRIQYRQTEQGRVEVLITHYDFGELSPTPPTEAQLVHCRQFIQEALAESFNPWKLFAMLTGQETPSSLLDGLSQKLMDYIHKHSQQAGPARDSKRDDLSRLRGLFKGLLALNDYFEVLAQDKMLMAELLPIIQKSAATQPAVAIMPQQLFSQAHAGGRRSGIAPSQVAPMELEGPFYR
jgi:hypothetical protein